MRFKLKPCLGLALSGGGARGLAHIGVLKALEEEGIKIDLIAGTSMGGFIAAAYALGYTPAQMEEEALRMGKFTSIASLLVDFSLPWKGLFEGKKFMDYFEEKFGNATFNDTRIPLALVAVDLVSGEEVVIREGKIVDAIRATVSVPGLFAPYTLGDKVLVDGGILNHLPADVVRRMGADVVVAVDVGVEEEKSPIISNRTPPVFSVLWRTVEVMGKKIRESKLQEASPDLLLCPPVNGDVSLLWGFHKAPEIIEAGYKEAKEKIPTLRKLLRPRLLIRR